MMKTKFLLTLLVVGLPFCAPAQQTGSDSAAIDALLKRVDAATQALTSFEGDVSNVATFTRKGSDARSTHGNHGHIRFLRPNLFRYEFRDIGQNPDAPPYTAVSDGTVSYMINEGKATRVGTAGPDARSFFEGMHHPLLEVYASGKLGVIFSELPEAPVKRMLPDEEWNGATYRVIEYSIGGGFPIVWKVYVGKDDLVHRILDTEPNMGVPYWYDYYFENLKVNTELAAADFAVKEAVASSDHSGRGNSAAASGAGEGDIAPDFSLPTPQGPRLALSTVMKGPKAVLVNFWFVHCPPCRAEHPKLNALYEELKGKGLDVLGIDDQDTPEHVTRYWEGAKLTFRTVLSGPRAPIDPKTGHPDMEALQKGVMLPDYKSLEPWGVHSCPTNFIIDTATGKIVYRASGWNEAAVRAKLAELGVK